MSSATIFLVFLLYKTFSISLTFSWRKFACHFVCTNLNCAFIVFVKDQQRFQLQDMDDAAECLVSKYWEYNSCSVLIVFNHPFVNCIIIWICHLFHRKWWNYCKYGTWVSKLIGSLSVLLAHCLTYCKYWKDITV
mgnify:CR=1 FL=1